MMGEFYFIRTKCILSRIYVFTFNRILIPFTGGPLLFSVLIFFSLPSPTLVSPSSSFTFFRTLWRRKKHKFGADAMTCDENLATTFPLFPRYSSYPTVYHFRFATLADKTCLRLFLFDPFFLRPPPLPAQKKSQALLRLWHNFPRVCSL